MTKREFAKAVRAARVARGWSLQRAAQEIHISHQALGYIERAMVAPRPLTRERIALVLEIPLTNSEPQSA